MKRCEEFELKLRRRVVLVRKKRGITQADVAEKLGVDQSAYSRMETGKSDITLKQFIAVCEAVDFPFAIFDGVTL